ncbi:VOC family protein [Bythopirellula polymerisocia]|uniref:Putative lyase n=1 Tax=Bythopirellula polymerisocia TaxID=2528003 RepID=A0A5C6CNM2_9BACT|nr:VOC family protein [Bythopirellula polymerisocia]TWU25978.1 putative lyase [Bythopirellula polymerisocia]
MTAKPLQLGPMDHVALLSTDPARGERFYCDVLGFHAVPRPSFSFDGRWLVHEEVGVMLHLIHRADHKPSGEGFDTLNGHFAIGCPDIDGAVAVLKSHGVEFVEKKLPDYGYRQLFLRDPDGNLLELGEWPRRI